MAKFMKIVVLLRISLSIEERNLFSFAYKNVLSTLIKKFLSKRHVTE